LGWGTGVFTNIIILFLEGHSTLPRPSSSLTTSLEPWQPSVQGSSSREEGGVFTSNSVHMWFALR
jgi:hypothetical protein